MHKQECKYDYTTLFINEPDKFIYTIPTISINQ
jgi:hypothetical protein